MTVAPRRMVESLGVVARARNSYQGQRAVLLDYLQQGLLSFPALPNHTIYIDARDFYLRRALVTPPFARAVLHCFSVTARPNRSEL